jgi:ABC-type multidrug transport system ATPase subunit
MADGKVLEFTGVTKVFGDVAAVSDLTARIEPGSVTAFLGPNGAGKTTTLRILLGQLKPTSGQATIGGTPYARISAPARTVGWVGESEMGFRPRRTAVRHLTSIAKSAGVPTARVREVLDLVGLADVADMRIGGYSLGMRQRLSVAQALLGDPGVLVFDEPANGLDPEGIRWMRLLMRSLADEGRTVLMSSHLLSEVQQIADRILIMSNGNLVFNGGIEQLAEVEAPVVAVDSPDRAALSALLRERGFDCEVLRSGVNVRGATAEEIGMLAASAGIPLSTLHQRTPSLEDVFLDLVSGRRSQQTAALGAPTASPATPAAVPAVEERIIAPTADEEPAVADDPARDAAGTAEPAGDPDAEVDLAAIAGLGGAAGVTGLAGAAATAFAADATSDPEPLPGARTAAELDDAGADADETDEAQTDEGRPDEAAGDGDQDGESAGDADHGSAEPAEEAASTFAEPADAHTDDAEASAEPGTEDAAPATPADAAPSFADVLAAVERESAEFDGPREETTEGAEGTPAEAPAEAGSEDAADSPWAVGPSFADRLGGAADAPAGDEPFDAEFLPSHLLETQAMDVVADADPEADAEVVEAELIDDPHGAEEQRDADQGHEQGEADGDAPHGEDTERRD